MRISRSGDYIAQIRLIGGRVFEKLLAASEAETFNGPQGKILDALWQEDGLSANEIGKKTGLANSTLTSMLDRMENAGLVKRLRSEKDRRVIRVFLGAKANECKEQYRKVSEEKEIEEFEQYLLRVLENVRQAECQIN